MNQPKVIQMEGDRVLMEDGTMWLRVPTKNIPGHLMTGDYEYILLKSPEIEQVDLTDEGD